MPLVDTTYQDDALDAVVASWPSSGGYRLYVSNPAVEADPTDVELGSDGGYAPVVYSAVSWDSAADGGKSTSAPISYGTSTDAFSDVATYWARVDGAGLLVFSDALTEPIGAAAAGTVVAFTPTLTFEDGA